MDNCDSPHWSTASASDELENIHISSSNDSDDSDINKFYYSDSEPEEFLENTVFPVQYNLPRRNHSMVHSSTNRTLMGRMAASNKSVRMKHGITALDIMVPLNRNTTTSLESRTTKRNLTTPLNSGTNQRDTTTQLRIPAQNALSPLSPYVPARRRFPSSSSSLIVHGSYGAQVPLTPSMFRSTAPPYSPPPPYPNLSQTSNYHKRSQYSTPPYVSPHSCPPYTTQSSMPVYTSLSPSLKYSSQSSVTYNNMSNTPASSIRSQSSASFYRSRCPTPTDDTPSQTSAISNVSQKSTYSKRSQSSISSYRSQYPTPTDKTLSSVPTHTYLYSTMSNTSQTSTNDIRSQCSTPSCGCPYSTSSRSSRSLASIFTSRPSTSTSNWTSPLRLNPSSAHYSASPSYSHYTFPRSSHYTMPILDTYCTVRSQRSYPLSVYEPRNVWPTEIGSVMQASMRNIWSVLATQVQNSLPPSTNACLQNTSRPSTTALANKNTSLLPIAQRENDHSLECVNPNPSNLSTTASNSSARNNSDQPEGKFIPLNIDNAVKNDIQYNIMPQELYKAWIYFSKMEVIDIKPNGEIKCICPKIKFNDLLKSSINSKLVIVNLYNKYKANNLLFETKYDYNSSPPRTVVDQNMKNIVFQWLKSQKMEKYDWFFNSLSFFEIENINPTNIQKFITRSKTNKTIPLEDQLKICCMTKKIKERPISLLAVSMNLREKRIDKSSFTTTIIPYIIEILLFPITLKHDIFDVVIAQSISIVIPILLFNVMELIDIDWAPDTNITTEKPLDIEMVSSEIICLNQLITELHLGSNKKDIEIQKKNIQNKITKYFSHNNIALNKTYFVM